MLIKYKISHFYIDMQILAYNYKRIQIENGSTSNSFRTILNSKIIWLKYVYDDEYA